MVTEQIAFEVQERVANYFSMKAQTSQATYRSILLDWCRFLGVDFSTREGVERMIQVSDNDVVKYMEWCRRRKGQKPRVATGASRDGGQEGQSDRTIAKKVMVLSKLYDVLKMVPEFGIGTNPFRGSFVQLPPQESGQKRPTEMVEDEKVREIVALPDRSTVKGRRDGAIIRLLFGGGLRRSEATKLRVSDVRTEQIGGEKVSYVTLRATKGGEDQELVLSEWVAEELVAWAEERRTAAGDSAWLFPSFRGRNGNCLVEAKISDDGLYRLFQAYCQRAGLAERYSPHSARATAITKLLDAGATHAEAKTFARHRSFEMVEKYDKRRRSVAKKLVDKLTY